MGRPTRCKSLRTCGEARPPETANVVSYYRLNDLGFRLAAGAHVVPRAELGALEEATRLVEQAQAKAAEIVKQAQDAYRREMQRGYDEGRARAEIESVERLIAESRVLDRGLER